MVGSNEEDFYKEVELPSCIAVSLFSHKIQYLVEGSPPFLLI
jgi:hypothetical protein